MEVQYQPAAACASDPAEVRATSRPMIPLPV
jgi:hypothetical protein